MRTKTIDHFLRATWQAVSKMYNEEASKYGASMATGLALLSIDTEEGVPSTSLGPLPTKALERSIKLDVIFPTPLQPDTKEKKMHIATNFILMTAPSPLIG